MAPYGLLEFAEYLAVMDGVSAYVTLIFLFLGNCLFLLPTNNSTYTNTHTHTPLLSAHTGLPCPALCICSTVLAVFASRLVNKVTQQLKVLFGGFIIPSFISTGCVLRRIVADDEWRSLRQLKN